MSDRTCLDCGAEITRKPGPGRWPLRCVECRTPKPKPPKAPKIDGPNSELGRKAARARWGRLEPAPCEVCGVTVPAGTVTCSPACRRKRTNAINKAKAQERRNAAGTPISYADCAWCGSLFVRRPGTPAKYCRQLCNRRAAAHERKVSGRGAEQRRKYADKRAEWQRANRHRYLEVRTCARCGAEFTAMRGHGTMHCSRSCAYSAPIPTRRELAERKASAAMALGTATVYTEGPCRTCGRRFTATGPGGRYCAQCRPASKRWISPRRRAAIYERDGWICYLCGFPVDMTADPRSLDAPTLDHVTPRAEGGSDADENLRTAHRLCNSYKRDLPLEAVA